MRNSKIIVAIILFSLVVGCTTNTITPAANTPSQTQLDDKTETPVPTARSVITELSRMTPTNTQVIPSVTPPSTATKMPEPTIQSSEIITDCLQVVDTWDPTNTSNGYIVLKSMELINGRYATDITWRNMETGDSTTTQFGVNFFVSPDLKSVAYHRSVYDESHKVVAEDLIVAAPNGQEISKYPWRDEWTFIVGWKDIEHILISLNQYDGTDLSIKTDPSPIAILDWKTGQIETWNESFPALLYPEKVLPDWGGTIGVSFSYDLSRAIYPRYVDTTKEMFTFALWDLDNQSLITTFPDVYKTFSLYNLFHQPIWSVDSSFFAVVGLMLNFIENDQPLLLTEIHTISKDGDVKQVTNLGQKFRPDENSLAISPNGELISFFLTTEESVSQKFGWVAFIDLKTNTIINTCVTIRHLGVGDYGGFLRSAIWSPDSSQVLVSDWYEEDHNRVILINFVHRTASVIAKDAEPQAWMITP